MAKNGKNPYLHIGGDTVVNENEIVGIFDVDKITVFKVNRDYLSNAEKRGKIISVTQDLPKSCVICCESGKCLEKVFLSPLLTSTLFKRSAVKALE